VVGTGALTEDEVLKVLQAREQLASTGVGSGVAIPHGRIAAAEKMLGALAISREGVAFESIDGEPARIFMAVLAPEKHTGDHLKALARISRLLRDSAVRQRLLAAQTAEEALQIVVEEDERH
jgi:PTS system nitrogen regulatory IIA component